MLLTVPSLSRVIRAFGIVAFAHCLCMQAVGADTTEQRPAPIQGRIEQLGTPDSKLPIDLTVQQSQVKLTPETAKLDTPPHKRLTATVSGFYSDMLGCWGGTLKTMYYIAGPGNDDPYRKAGTTCKVVFNFTKLGEEIVLKPVVLYFPRETAVKDPYRLSGDSNTAKWQWEVPITTLGNARWVDKQDDSKVKEDRIVHDSTKILKDGAIEEDIVIQSNETGKPSRYTETVLRFTRSAKGEMLAQVAMVDYSTNRVPFRKWLWEGSLSRNWQEVATRIAADHYMTLHDYERKYPDLSAWYSPSSGTTDGSTSGGRLEPAQ